MLDWLVAAFEQDAATVIAAGVGAFVAILSQVLIHRYRVFMAAKRYRQDPSNLRKHVRKSLESLDLSPDRPRYLIAARLRFCKYLDGLVSMKDLEWLTQRKDSQRILPTLMRIRNSDIFMEELASRVDSMTEEELVAALEDGRVNMQILGASIEALGYKEFPDDKIIGGDFSTRMIVEGESRAADKEPAP